MPDIMHLIRIRVAPEVVYAALTTEEGVRNWWTQDSELDSAAQGTGEFRFRGGKIVTQVNVEELEAPSHIRWRTISSSLPDWCGTTIHFDLRVEGEATALRFAHRGWAECNDAYAQTTTGWGYYLVSLQQYLETGTGAPAPDVDFSRVIR